MGSESRLTSSIGEVHSDYNTKVKEMFKPLQLHAYHLAKAMMSIDVSRLDYEDVHDWLLLASGIDKLEFDVTKYDSCLGYCIAAEEYEGKKEELTEEFVRNLAIFQFIWGSLEALINELNLPKVPNLKRGRTKIDSPCYYIKCNEKPEFNKLEYEHVFEQFKKTAAMFFEPSDFQSYFSCKKHVSYYSQGLYVIYKIRNHFAHGHTGFPEPDRHEEGINYEANLMKLSSRIVLLTIQMIILAYYANRGAIVDCYWTEDFEKERGEIPLTMVFSELQINRQIP